MLSGNSEVSTLNKDTQDSNDNFKVECEKQEKDSVVTGATVFYLKNEKLNNYLYNSKYNNFHEGNCGSRCPIIGQLEVSGVASKSANCRWKVESGVFVENDFDHEKQSADDNWVFDQKETTDSPLTTDL